MHYSVRIFLTKGVFVVNFRKNWCVGRHSCLGRRGGEKVNSLITKLPGMRINVKVYSTQRAEASWQGIIKYSNFTWDGIKLIPLFS
jgi:hypothetical protein